MKCNQSRPGFELVYAVSISHDDNHYTTGTSYGISTFKGYLINTGENKESRKERERICKRKNKREEREGEGQRGGFEKKKDSLEEK